MSLVKLRVKIFICGQEVNTPWGLLCVWVEIRVSPRIFVIRTKGT